MASDAYSQLRAHARSLALTTIFDKPHERDIICDLLQLGLELEKIKEIASEPMLAMIRMQWWYDLFEAGTLPHEAPDFAKRLYDNNAITKADLLHIVQTSRDSLQTPIPEVSWETLFIVIAKSNDWQISVTCLRQMGRNFAALYQDDERQQYHALSDRDIKQASGGNYGFMRLMNLLISRQITQRSDSDPLLIFRFLFRLLF
ncbi:MAG: hypothetical protein ACON49_07925 [Candidatus Puniceispirillaceae bacterium]